MKNEYETYGDLTIIYAKTKGDVLPLLIDTEDLPTVERISTWSIDAQGYGVGYLPGESRGRLYLLHRVVMGDFDGDIPEGHVVDHMRHRKYDCRKENLRVVTHAENTRNRKIPGRGYTFNKSANKWQAYVTIDGKFKHLGLFKSERKAASVAKEARQEQGQNV